jgi:hypothetical protein
MELIRLTLWPQQRTGDAGGCRTFFHARRIIGNRRPKCGAGGGISAVGEAQDSGGVSGGVGGGVGGGGVGVSGGGVGGGVDGGVGVGGKLHRLGWIFGGSPGDACSTENRQHHVSEETAFEIFAMRRPYDRQNAQGRASRKGDRHLARLF